MGPRAAALAGVVIGASLFAIVHERFTWPVILLLGLFLGGLYARTRNLWAPVAFHVTHNLCMVATFILAPPGQGP
jgi:membrane protease YdiL (CAAX protease family)